MTRWIFSLVIAISALTVFVAADPPSCSPSQKCPSEAPCCSRILLQQTSVLICYRIRSLRYVLSKTGSSHADFVGIGSYCLGGCDPRFSFSIGSCMPAPQCRSRKYTFENVSKSLADYTTYLGDSTKADWSYSGYPLQYGSDLLPNSAGSVIMSTEYVYYGKVSATLKTSKDQGVITAFMYDSS